MTATRSSTWAPARTSPDDEGHHENRVRHQLGTRYYTANGQTTAVRSATSGVSGTKLSFLAADQHGTSSVAMDASTYAVTKRYSTPFGVPRGTKPTSWPDDKAFLDKPADDTTGLAHVGAREYDPKIGQFTSADPLLGFDHHQTQGLLGCAAGADNTFLR